MEPVQKARCVHCRSEIAVPESYHHGDHIPCGTCGTSHKVIRGDVLKLVIADATPLKDAYRENQAMVNRLEAELHHARGSFGLGANGFGIALAYALYQILRADHAIDLSLAIESLVVALVSGILLEALNYFFFAKRKAIRRLSAEIRDAEAESRELQRKIREASRV